MSHISYHKYIRIFPYQISHTHLFTCPDIFCISLIYIYSYHHLPTYLPPLSCLTIYIYPHIRYLIECHSIKQFESYSDNSIQLEGGGLFLERKSCVVYDMSRWSAQNPVNVLKRAQCTSILFILYVIPCYAIFGGVSTSLCISFLVFVKPE